MNVSVKYQVDPVIRTQLDFRLDEVPRFWFGGDPFRTRMFDALSLAFPEGERYFIESVRLFRHKITDPELQQKVRAFIRQEAQHGIAHDKMNQMMKDQGMPVDQFVAMIKKILQFELNKRSAQYNIAMTAATEHLTALMAESFYRHKTTLQDAHPYVRALFAWHAIEEMEHRDVTFDVMQQVGEVPELLRRFALIFISLMLFSLTLYRTNIMLKYDGFTTWQRIGLIYRGLPWFFGKHGTLSVMKGQYLDWFKRDFHPSQHPVIRQYDTWLETLKKTNDPIAAGDAFWQAAL
ncbi:metal-dependent hydrolase [Acinetobacter sp. WZC-1]|uniref:metal-dependent hydrolase n=1 Tax=Acinetobacter sp. WZC-1 TaxID=3459034 RepID=UPI00403DA30A